MSAAKRSPTRDEISQPDTLPAVLPRRPPTLALAPDAMPDEWHHNYDLSTPEGKAGLINASNVPDWIPSDGKPEQLLVRHYVCFPSQVTDRETGEVSEVTSLVLIGHDGRTARFNSEWTLRRMHAILRMYTAREWQEGVLVECYSAPSRRQGRTYGSFRVIAPAAPQTAS